MPAQIIEFPFDSGQYEAADRAWLPSTLLAVVENMRLDLDGRLGVRPGNTALPTTTYSANALVAYDLANYSGRLVALGDQLTLGRPTDLFEYVNSKAAWRATSGDDTTIGSADLRIPRATKVRDVGRVAELAGGVNTAHVATDGTLICVAASTSNSACVARVFNPATDQTIVMHSFRSIVGELTLVRCVYAGSDFWVIGVDDSDNIVGFNFDPSTDEAFAGPTTLVAVGSTIANLAVAQTGASDFTIAYTNGGDVFASRHNSAGVQQASWTVSTDNAGAVDVCGNSAGTLISVGWHVIGSDYSFSTFNASGTLQSGPTSLFGGATCALIERFGMSQHGDVICFVGAADASTANDVDTLTQQCSNQTTHALGSTRHYRDSVPTTRPVYMANGSSLDRFYFGAINYAAAANGQGTNQLVEEQTGAPQCFKDGTLGPQVLLDVGFNEVNGACAIGTKLYWATLQQTADTGNSLSVPNTFAVTECEMTDTGRRQMTQLANELHIAGGLPLVYDGQCLVEHGFAEKPQILSLAAASGGSKTLLGTYFVQATWEVLDARQNIVRAAVSDPEEITLTGSNQSITAIASTPHSLRTLLALQREGGYTVRVGFYCTTAGGANFFIDKSVRLDPSTGDMGTPVTATLTQPDDTLRDNAVIYTQSQTPLAHVAPPPYQYSWPGRERQLVGGLPLDEQWTFSKLLFPSEPVEFASQGRLGFSGRANDRITAVGAFEQVGLVWTKREIYSIPGRGPDHDGTGDFDSAILIPSPGGCQDWRSLVSTPLGFFFQMQPDKLMLLTRGGEVQWIGQAVRETLATYPVITGAVHIRSQMTVVFSCTNQAGSSGVLLVYDLRRNVWYVDTVGPVASVSELDGRLAYVSGGTVYLQDAAAGSGTFVPSAVQTGFLPVTKRLGWGLVYRFGLLGIDSGACSVQCLVDYDDGNGFVDHGTETFTGTGKRFERFWSAKVPKTARFAVRFVVTSASADSLGVRLNAWAAEVEGAKNMTRAGSTGVVA